MRFLSATIGVAVGLPALIFFWIGSQTFIRPHEKALAVGMTFGVGALTLVSAALLFTPAAQKWQATLLGFNVGALALIYDIRPAVTAISFPA